MRLALLRLVIATVAVFAAPSVASAASTSGSVALYSDPGDYIGQGQRHVLTSNDTELGISGDSKDVQVTTNGRDGLSVELAARPGPGQRLVRGVYDRAERAAFRSVGHPGLDVSGEGRGCDEIDGRFEVKDIAIGPTGAVQRLWAVFEQHCEGAVAALFGEVKVGYPMSTDAFAAAPAIVRWPAADAGRRASTVPVLVTALAPTTFSGARVTGPAASAFSLTADGCRGATLLPRRTCEVHVRYRPVHPGTRTAALEFRSTGGARSTVALQGFAYGGLTRAVLRSDRGDFAGGGAHDSYTPANAAIAAFGVPSHVAFGLGDVGLLADFESGPHRVLAPGRFEHATRYPFNTRGPGLSVVVGGGCNTIKGRFAVSSAAFGADKRVRAFGARFEQHCEGARPALRGEFDFRAGDMTRPAPWMPASATNDRTYTGAGLSRLGRCRSRRFARSRTIRGTTIADRLRGSRRSEVIVSGPGDDSIQAGAGGDCIDGSSGNDHLSGDAGDDVIVGGSGNDRLSGGPGHDLLDCGPGRDTAYVTPGDRTLHCERVVRVGTR